jgi:hypothetical protein
MPRPHEEHNHASSGCYIAFPSSRLHCILTHVPVHLYPLVSSTKSSRAAPRRGVEWCERIMELEHCSSSRSSSSRSSAAKAAAAAAAEITAIATVMELQRTVGVAPAAVLLLLLLLLQHQLQLHHHHRGSSTTYDPCIKRSCSSATWS